MKTFDLESVKIEDLSIEEVSELVLYLLSVDKIQQYIFIINSIDKYTTLENGKCKKAIENFLATPFFTKERNNIMKALDYDIEDKSIIPDGINPKDYYETSIALLKVELESSSYSEEFKDNLRAELASCEKFYAEL